MDDEIEPYEFDLGVDSTHDRYDREVEDIVTQLITDLGVRDTCDPQTVSIAQTIIPAIVQSEDPYTLEDVYHVLTNRSCREKFGKRIPLRDR